mmetsp:Transcript_9813/g.18572  ORF Transcript_9813/g.18572 Transcript_9813/m.18572 type:complete len:159 (+) Transcript_9813:3-479(+)
MLVQQRQQKLQHDQHQGNVDLKQGNKWCRVVSDASTCSPGETNWQRYVSDESEASDASGDAATSVADVLDANDGLDNSSEHGDLVAAAAFVALITGIVVAWNFLPAVALLALFAVLVPNVVASAVTSSSRQHVVFVGVWLPFCAFSAAAFLAPLAPPC